MSELEACPFCGKKDLLYYRRNGSLAGCERCDVEADAEMWNQRPLEDQLKKNLLMVQHAGIELAKQIKEMEKPQYGGEPVP